MNIQNRRPLEGDGEVPWRTYATILEEYFLPPTEDFFRRMKERMVKVEREQKRLAGEQRLVHARVTRVYGPYVDRSKAADNQATTPAYERLVKWPSRRPAYILTRVIDGTRFVTDGMGSPILILGPAEMVDDGYTGWE